MTQTLTFSGTYRLDLLMDELLAAFPHWLVQVNGFQRSQLRLEGNAEGIRLEIPDADDPLAVTAVVQAHNPAASSKGDTLRQQIINLAQSAVGLPVNELTANQTRALVAVLLYKQGALTHAGTVRPLSDWN